MFQSQQSRARTGDLVIGKQRSYQLHQPCLAFGLAVYSLPSTPDDESQKGRNSWLLPSFYSYSWFTDKFILRGASFSHYSRLSFLWLTDLHGSRVSTCTRSLCITVCISTIKHFFTLIRRYIQGETSITLTFLRFQQIKRTLNKTIEFFVILSLLLLSFSVIVLSISKMFTWAYNVIKKKYIRTLVIFSNSYFDLTPATIFSK